MQNKCLPPPSTLGYNSSATANPMSQHGAGCCEESCLYNAKISLFAALARNDKKRTGFTLIELSIVLVIIGLVVGGVMVGQDLISAARIRAQIKQFETYKLAVGAFKVKYNCLPGDCASATSFELGNNGDGDGVLELNDITSCTGWITDNSYTSPDCGWNAEFPWFYQHLSASKMIGGSYGSTFALGTGYPEVSLNPTSGIMPGGSWQSGTTTTTPDSLKTTYGFPAGFWLHALICNPNGAGSDADWSNTNDDCGVFTPLQMQQIDVKIDDGNPLKGVFWGYSGYWSSAVPECLNAARTGYAITTTSKICHASYRLY